ncbi:acyltransferase family protein [Subtercola frigoramans]
MPKNLWEEFGHQITASALYVENWALASNAVDYSALASDASPVQHFWSLSVEEQFYLFWPLLLVTAAVLARRFSSNRRHLVIVIAAVSVASLAYSIVETRNDPSAAYFVTPTRVWELGIGGLLAFAVDRWKLPEFTRVPASWVGIAAIVYASYFYSSSTPFPGWQALIPVGGACVVIWAGTTHRRYGTSALFALRPIQAVGDVSYSLYLWHWPLIVILPFALGAELNQPMRIGIVLVSLVLAFVTRVYVELAFIRPHGADLEGRGRIRLKGVRVLVAVLAVMAVVAVPAAGMSAYASTQIASAETRMADILANPPACFGAAALVVGSVCSPTKDSEIVPSPILAETDDFAQKGPGLGCQISGAQTSARQCVFGDVNSKVRIALVGDSHAAQWQPALAEIAVENKWSLTTLVRSSCPYSSVLPTNANDNSGACVTWNRNVGVALAEGGFSLVIVSTLSDTHFQRQGDETNFEAATRGFSEAWGKLIESGTPVVAIRDNPLPTSAGIHDEPSCVASHSDPTQCDVSEAKALVADPQVPAVIDTPGSRLIDLTGAFCISKVCPAVIGDVLVYRNKQHITATYMSTLAPILEQKLRVAAPQLWAVSVAG